MPRKERKKFRKLVAARQTRLRTMYDILSARQNWRRMLLHAVRLPLLTAAVYVLLWQLGAFSFLTPLLHGLALMVFLLWIVQTVRGEVGFWSHRAHLRFFLPIVMLVIAGSCWGGISSDAAKAWVTPPSYANLPAEQLSAIQKNAPVLMGSLVQVSWQGQPQTMTLHFAGKQETLDATDDREATLSLTAPRVNGTQKATLMLRRGWLRLALWTFDILPDAAPQIAVTEEPEITARGTIRFAFEVSDDYGVEAVMARIAPTAAQPADVKVDPIEIPLAKPDLKQMKTAAYADLTHLPWAGIPVSVQLIAIDGAKNKGWSAPRILTLPTRAFRNPFARALIEERAKLLARPDAAMRDEAANVMAGIARQQGLYDGDKVVMMTLRAGAARLVLNRQPETVDSVASMLWQTAVRLEEGVMGLARADLAEAERDLSLALLHQHDPDSAMSYWLRLQESMTRYFDVLSAERARQPPALQELDWPLATAQEMLVPEDLQSRLTMIGALLKNDDVTGAHERLAQLQTLIENLRTTPPELTPAQSLLAQQVSSLRALVRSQKALNEETDRLAETRPSTAKEKKALAYGTTRSLAQQQLLIAALNDVVSQSALSMTEAQTAMDSMRRASSALQKNDLAAAQDDQANALALLQNTLLTLSDQIKRSLAAQAPEKQPQN